MQILTIGEILWDVFDHAEHLGGAPLNFSAALHRLGSQVNLISGLGSDNYGTRALQAMTERGLPTQFVQVFPEKATGTARVTTDEKGNTNFFIQRPAAFDEVQLDASQLSAIEALKPDWIYYGTLTQTHAPALATLETILHRVPTARRFYDMNLRTGHWNLALVQRLSQDASILKLNDAEAETLFELTCPNQSFSLDSFAAYWSATYNVDTICITLGSKGCAVYKDKELHIFNGFTVQVADTVGAGDAFAAAFLYGQIRGWAPSCQANFANALGALVASRAGATPAWTAEECIAIMSERASDPAARAAS